MEHMWQHPTRVWILPEEGEEPSLVSIDEVNRSFQLYEDTGYEPKLDWLYERIGCDTVDMRHIPGLGHMWIDDEGILKRRTLSPAATVLYGMSYFPNPIVGTCILVVYPDVREGVDNETIRLAMGKWMGLKAHFAAMVANMRSS